MSEKIKISSFSIQYPDGSGLPNDQAEIFIPITAVDGLEEKLAQNTNNIIAATWGELKELKENKNLVPSQLYRITDYSCTTTQENTVAENHNFDIIVQALSTSELSEDALADYREGDSYFINGEVKNANLSAWKLKYCFENDTNRFIWADAENGKGVVYWLRDEWGNEAGYDFKNIKFKINVTEKAEIGEAFGIAEEHQFYTFSYIDSVSKEILDATVLSANYKNSEGGISYTYQNTIEPYLVNEPIDDHLVNIQQIPKNVIIKGGLVNDWNGFNNIHFEDMTVNNVVILTAFVPHVTLSTGIVNKTINIEESYEPIVYEANNVKHIILD